MQGLGVGCGLVFCAAFGFGCSAFAVVSFALVAGLRPALVLVVPCGGDFVCPQCVGRSAYVVVSFVHVVGWLVVVLRVGIGRSACAVVSFHLFLGSAPRSRQKVKTSRRKLAVFK